MCSRLHTRRPSFTQPPKFNSIESYGLIGNMRTAALVGKSDGSIDFMCYPHFDSPTIFARMLDIYKGGWFSIQPQRNFSVRQHYLPETNCLQTRYMTNEGVALLTDYMPIVSDLPEGEDSGWLIREIELVMGVMSFEMECFPAFNYGRDEHEAQLEDDGHKAVFKSPKLSIVLESPNCKLEKRFRSVSSSFTLKEHDTMYFVLRSHNESKPLGMNKQKFTEYCRGLKWKTIDYWQTWIRKCTYQGRWRELVHRSAFTLKLMIFEPTGAIVASPTFSLPETIEGERNWDYRCVFVRESSFVLYALLRIGFKDEATAFMNFLEARFKEELKKHTQRDSIPPLHTYYGIHGEHHIPEELLHHLTGYKFSKPVRIGTARSNEGPEINIFGAVMDAVYLYNKHVTPISYNMWQFCCHIVTWVCDHYQTKDNSIWDPFKEKEHYVFSKVMCWVCIDRGLRLAEKRSLPCDYDKWYKARDQLYDEIMKNGYNTKIGAFTQYYGSDIIDASVLICPMVFFISPYDPRMISTINAINKSPKNGGLRASSLVYRYNVSNEDEQTRIQEKTFSVCALWLIEALARAGALNKKFLMDARLLFEQMLTFSNHAGLFAEELSYQGEMLGNFPQALTHLAFISAAFNLNRSLTLAGEH